MSALPQRIRLTCPHCSATSVCGPDAMLPRLQLLGMLRREKQPDRDLVVELFRSSLGRVTCSACDRVGLIASSPEDACDDEAWGAGRRCESCGRTIPMERVELLPHVERCVACQQNQESGASARPVEYCARCGTVLRMRLRPGDGLARYEPYCPECRR